MLSRYRREPGRRRVASSRRLGDHPEAAVVTFTVDDIVRSGFCIDVIRAYAKP